MASMGTLRLPLPACGVLSRRGVTPSWPPEGRKRTCFSLPALAGKPLRKPGTPASSSGQV